MHTFRLGTLLLAAAVVVAALSTPASANVQGAIFTTLFDGSTVNANIYDSKDAVYLNGGPPQGAPADAAGLPCPTGQTSCIYVFQVTDPSGKKLLSSDAAKCRQFIVSGGITIGVVNSGCQHVTFSPSVDHGATTVQLMPYDDTTNNGGEYKAWVEPLADFLANCAALGVSNGLNVVDCGGPRQGNFHGFIGSDDKTDNFKVNGPNLEIDTIFHSASGDLNGILETWIDTTGAINPKYSYTDQYVNHRAHVEAPEVGTHQIVIGNQIGCTIDYIGINPYPTSTFKTAQFFNGPQVLSINIKPAFVTGTVVIEVFCK